MKYSIAILMTCFNRKDTTLNCLEKLFQSSSSLSIDLNVFLVDDGSTDGTGDAVKQRFPKVRVFQGDGTLFWCGGMRVAFGEALKKQYDYYLWLNDDTELFPFAIDKLLKTSFNLSKKLGYSPIIVGSLCDPEHHKLTYGGSTLGPWWHPTRYQMIQPSDTPLPCDLFHGNCVLIPEHAARKVGNMSADYKHGPGDKDYALRSAVLGISSWICDGYVGTCSKNHLIERWRRKDLSMGERVKSLNHPVVVARVEDWIIFSKNYHKSLWPYFVLSSYIRITFPEIYIQLKMLSQSRKIFLKRGPLVES